MWTRWRGPRRRARVEPFGGSKRAGGSGRRSLSTGRSLRAGKDGFSRQGQGVVIQTGRGGTQSGPRTVEGPEEGVLVVALDAVDDDFDLGVLPREVDDEGAAEEVADAAVTAKVFRVREDEFAARAEVGGAGGARAGGGGGGGRGDGEGEGAAEDARGGHALDF